MTVPSNHLTRILLVDDDPAMVRLLTRVIQRELGQQVQIDAVTNPQEARTWIENRVVHVLITDLEMPGLSGLELLRCAKRRNACTQVLLITGHTTLDALIDALELGANDYLLKPLDQAQFAQILGEACQRQRRWQEALAGTLTERSAAVCVPSDY